MISSTTLEVLDPYGTRPVKTALMLCDPTVRELVEYVATPELRVTVPSVVLPS
jgi:hypothetical protein